MAATVLGCDNHVVVADRPAVASVRGECNTADVAGV
jgi:hypothetical protein